MLKKMVESNSAVESPPAEKLARCPPRRRLSDRERWPNRRTAQERWKGANRERYLEQKRTLARQPDYLAKRRARYQQRKSSTGSGKDTSEGGSDE